MAVDTQKLDTHAIIRIYTVVTLLKTLPIINLHSVRAHYSISIKSSLIHSDSMLGSAESSRRSRSSRATPLSIVGALPSASTLQSVARTYGVRKRARGGGGGGGGGGDGEDDVGYNNLIHLKYDATTESAVMIRPLPSEVSSEDDDEDDDESPSAIDPDQMALLFRGKGRKDSAWRTSQATGGGGATAAVTLPTFTAAHRANVLALTGIRVLPVDFESTYAATGALLKSEEWRKQLTRGNLDFKEVVSSLREGDYNDVADLLDERVRSGCAFFYGETDCCTPHYDKGKIDSRWMLRATRTHTTVHYLMVQTGSGIIYNVVFMGPFIYFGDPDASILCKLKHAVPSPTPGSGNIITWLLTVDDDNLKTFSTGFSKAIEESFDENEWIVPTMEKWKWSPGNIPLVDKRKGGALLSSTFSCLHATCIHSDVTIKDLPPSPPPTLPLHSHLKQALRAARRTNACSRPKRRSRARASQETRAALRQLRLRLRLPRMLARRRATARRAVVRIPTRFASTRNGRQQ